MATPSRKAKSFKADGTPKKRWTPEQRAARKADKRGAKPARHNDNRFEKRGEKRRDEWSRDFRDRTERPEKRSRHSERPVDRRDDRWAGERPAKKWGDRPEKWSDRPQSRREDRPGYNRRWDDRRDDRRSFERRDDRRTFERSDDRRDEGRSSERFDRRRSSEDFDRPRGKRAEQSRPAKAWKDRPARPERRRFDDDRPRRHERREERPREAEATDVMNWEAAAAPEVTHIDSGFTKLGVSERLASALGARGITEPFPIQVATIPDALRGRDVLGRAQTGSGKTLAFGLPTLDRIHAAGTSGAPSALILTPTRELAMQVADSLSPLAAALDLSLILIAGGMSYGPQLRAFERGVDVVVATPGRLIDLLEQGAVDLSKVQVTILDEADHMADLGFMPAVTTLLDAVPSDGQRLLFSATLDDAVSKLVKRYLHDPHTHEVDANRASVKTMRHRLLHTAPHHKNEITAQIANRDGRTLVFARTQRGADRVAGQLRDVGVMAGALHGGLTQGARARVLSAFKAGTVPVLVATDVAARGIHVDEVSLVLQIDPPRDSKDYLHRAGRTARAGEEGVVASIVLPHQRKMVKRITGQAGVKDTPIDVEPGSVELREATGARPPSGVPIEQDDYLALIAPPAPKRRPRPVRKRRERY